MGTHERFMSVAIEEARRALALGEVPIGAVLVMGDRVVARGCNEPISTTDPIESISIAAHRNTWPQIKQWSEFYLYGIGAPE